MHTTVRENAVQGSASSFVQGDSSSESQSEYYRVASSIELVYHHLPSNLLYIIFSIMSRAFMYIYLDLHTSYCSEEAVLQAAGNGDIEKLRRLNEREVNFKVTDTVSMKL